jgi:Tol biopolymer transport system component
MNLSKSPTWDENPAWSPDGRYIAFIGSSPDGNGSSDIYVVNIDGSQLTNLTNSIADDGSQGPPVWSPDGQNLAFVSYRKNRYDIYIINVKTGQERPLNVIQVSDVANPQWSPNGQQLVFTGVPNNDN